MRFQFLVCLVLLISPIFVHASAVNPPTHRVVGGVKNWDDIERWRATQEELREKRTITGTASLYQEHFGVEDALEKLIADHAKLRAMIQTALRSLHEQGLASTSRLRAVGARTLELMSEDASFDVRSQNLNEAINKLEKNHGREDVIRFFRQGERKRSAMFREAMKQFSNDLNFAEPIRDELRRRRENK